MRNAFGWIWRVFGHKYIINHTKEKRIITSEETSFYKNGNKMTMILYKM
jgi:hypothetical protein